jgi:sirohydrochlorin cobaltochelatase
MAQLAALVAMALPEVAVELGYLELSDPPAGEALDRLVAAGAQRVGIVPLMLLAAGHAKSDVPAVVLEGRLRHPDVALAYGRPFGADHGLLALASRRLAEVGGAGVSLAVMARGTSDPMANAEACMISRMVAEFTAAPVVTTGFSGMTWPTVPEALGQLERLGATRMASFSWYLATGVLIDRIQQQLADFTAATGIDVLDAGYLGPAPEVVELIVERYQEAIAGAVRMSCDACVYRRPFPGLEDRVGMPLGVGHSHLAAAHRNGHDHQH